MFKRRKQQESQLSAIANRVSLLQQSQLKVAKQIRSHERSLDLKEQIRRQHTEMRNTRRMQHFQEKERQQQITQSNYFKKQQLVEQRKQLQQQYQAHKIKMYERLKMEHYELEKRLQQQKESQLIKNHMRCLERRSTRANSHLLKPVTSEYDMRLERESHIKLKPEESIRKLEQVEQALLEDYQRSLLVKQQLQQKLVKNQYIKGPAQNQNEVI